MEKKRTRKFGSLNINKAREKVEVELLKKALSKASYNLSYAAQELGVSRPTIYDLIRKHGIERK